NMMLTSDGTIKILDFGLAKTAASTKLTQMGSTLGTVAYMSPEQARGEEVDRRSDIWSLGVILYEMITGVLPFRGDYEQAVVYGILNEDPDSMTTLRAGVPMALDGVIAKMLAKDPDLRYQNVDELPADLKAIDVGSAITRSRISTGSRSAIAPAASAVSGPAVAAETIAAPDRKKPWYASPIAIGAATLVLGAALGFLLRGSPPDAERPVRHLSLRTHGIQDARHPTVSPDGEFIAFAGTDTTAGQETLFVSEMATGRIHSFAGSVTDPYWMSFSPDGRWLLYSSAAGVFRMLVPDGQPIQIQKDSDWATWETNDTIILADGEIKRMSVSGGEAESLASADSAKGHSGLYAPRMLGSDHVLCTAQRTDGNWDVVNVDLTAGEYTVLVTEAAAAFYVSTGHLLYMRDVEGAGDAAPLAVQPFDLNTMAFSGSPVPLPIGEQEWYHYGFGDDGTFIYTEFTQVTSGSQINWIDLEGREVETLPLEAARYDIPSISPDGQRLAMERFNEAEQQWDIYVFELADGTPLRLSFAGSSENPTWSPDGRYVYYDGQRQDKRVLIRKSADGSGTEEVLAAAGAPARNPNVSSDGQTVIFEISGEEDFDIWWLDLRDSSLAAVAVKEGGQFDAEQSPDGRFVVHESQETGSGQIFVRQLGGAAFWEISEGSGTFGDPMWSPDGNYIYFENNGSRLLRVPVQTTPSFRRLGRPEVVADFDTDIDFALHPDGNRILILSNQMGGVEVNNGLQVVQNWFEEVNRMAPASK
ncbi:MAG: protein kinase, partial [Rhodothermales bacterium]|nr:protein kinase [Rhodothermales bacterium]